MSEPILIYVLELENNKYYVGKTTNPDFRLKQHFNSYGSEWTKKYKPKKILEIISNCEDIDEDKYTLKYMEKYGINNVRGGTFYELKLNNEKLNTIKKMLNDLIDKCYICGNDGHYATDCVQDEDNILGEFETLYYENKTSKKFEDMEDEIEIFVCDYCGEEFNRLKAVTNHENLYCKYKKDKLKKI